MDQKNLLRKKYFNLRKRKYYEININFLLPLIKFMKFNIKKKLFKIGLYYPSNYEINILKILENNYITHQNILLPAIEENNQMNFYSWNKNEVLFINRYGLLEPLKTKIQIPDIIIVPILVFDNSKHRIGYGKGFYDHYLTKFLKKYNKIITVGVAFSFQRYHKLPISKYDVKLDFIYTEEGLIK